MSPIHKVTFQRLDSPLDVVANRTRCNLRLKRDAQILPPFGPFEGAALKARTGIITEGRRNQQQRGQSEEKKAFHEYPPYALGVFANNLVLTWQLTGALGMEPMRSRPVRAWSAAKYGIVLHQGARPGPE